MSEDPFFAVKDEVEMAMANATQLFQNWNRLQLSVSSSTPFSQPSDAFQQHSSSDAEELRWTTTEIKGAIQSIELDLKDLEDTVKIVQANPERFKLDPREVVQRKDFVKKMKKTVEEMKQAVNNPSTIKRTETAQRNTLLASKPSPGDKSSPQLTNRQGPTQQDYERRNTRFIENESLNQQQIMRHQDQQLDGISSTITGMREVATVIGMELDDQTRLIEDVDERVDTTSGKLKAGMKRLDNFIQSNSNKKQQITICILVIILIIVLVCVISL
ncbi:syntaxin 6, N-terminal-domain-containing protein [Polychytrium aggregatum]|uniref:syntaxin 6, N-terminal-domain-containing protein n=1 Tax=Polychytrium aggregatum TaxID=110093 RepID=UPI0022FEC754|nr:syntaxin 6, N-terminal-domain-containing protein [Polychytrium aggregatum]KAI9207433.1 syntaxin 6, N-terminal-domain-containing protein [Polychytrium aggregatum]